jgi:hypothetical protein
MTYSWYMCSTITLTTDNKRDHTGGRLSTFYSYIRTLWPEIKLNSNPVITMGQ